MAIRTDYCGLIDGRFIGKVITVQGWVHRRRDHGGIIFLDLRDREGLVQIVCDPDSEAFKEALKVRSEYVISITGLVRPRPIGTENVNITSGNIEIAAQLISVFNTAATPPFQIDDNHLSENVRLQNRIIDLRRPEMQQHLRLRYRTTMLVRNFLDSLGFIDIETPLLTRSTPEGARDYLVPSRVHPGEFFALPQSPQLFKQLLMMAGFDRYYQIAKCFRDEDLRADRQPEFTQIDLETSFLDENQIMEIGESLTRCLFKEILNVNLPEFPRLSYQEAIFYYGSDKPDLRIALKFTELTDIMTEVPFNVFNRAANMQNGRVVALRIPNGASILSRADIDNYTHFVGLYGAKGLAYIKINDKNQLNEQGLQSPIVKNLPAASLQAIIDRTQAEDGDLIFFGADKSTIVEAAMGALRVKIGHEKGLAETSWKPLWVIDFPMFEYDEAEKRFTALHHPFTSPKEGHEALLSTAPEQCLARAYDLVINGWEVGGGSIRIHQADIQSKVFAALNIETQEAKERFGFLLDNLRYGAPPHGGLAFGLDRLAALLAGVDSIRDVIAFPKTQRAQCLLTNAPGPVDEKQLQEAHIRLRSPA